MIDLIDLYLQEIKTIYQLDDQQEITVYVMEKPTVNRIEKDKITKDGIHLLFDIQCEREVQMMIREGVLKKIGDVFRSMKKTQNAEKGYESALGMNYKDLTEKWHKYLKMCLLENLHLIMNLFLEMKKKKMMYIKL